MTTINLTPNALTGLLIGTVVTPSSGVKPLTNDQGEITGYRTFFTADGILVVGKTTIDDILEEHDVMEFAIIKQLEETLTPGMDYVSLTAFPISYRDQSANGMLSELSTLLSGDLFRMLLSIPYSLPSQYQRYAGFSSFIRIHRFRLLSRSSTASHVSYATF